MAKRKNSVSSEEEFEKEGSSSDSAPVAEKSKSKKKASATPSIKKPRFGTGNDPKFENVKPENTSSGNNDGMKVLVNAEGDKYIDLGKKRRAVVRSFKGVSLLDVREYYGEPGEEKPGKKGISLTLDQWKLLRASVDIVDNLFSDLEKKK